MFAQLQRQMLEDFNMEVYYWKDEKHWEVDFVIKEKNLIKQLIQVCFDLSDVNTKTREIKALIKAGNELKCDNLLIITDDFEYEEEISTKKIKYIPLWKWLIEN